MRRTSCGGKVVVLDANSKILAEPLNFTKAFKETHKGIITYVPNAQITSINADTMKVISRAGTFTGKVINAIPKHKAGNLITQSGVGLANRAYGKWASVNVLSYESTNSALSGIHIIGDSSSTTQPKAGHIANAEAKVCVEAFKGGTIEQSPMTNSSCFTLITSKTASWLTAIYRYDHASKTMMVTGNGVTESNGYDSENHEDMLKWFKNLMADTLS